MVRTLVFLLPLCCARSAKCRHSDYPTEPITQPMYVCRVLCGSNTVRTCISKLGCHLKSRSIRNQSRLGSSAAPSSIDRHTLSESLLSAHTTTLFGSHAVSSDRASVSPPT